MRPPRPIQRITENRSYPNTDTSALGERALEALSDETAGAILRESARLPEKEMVLGMVRQFTARMSYGETARDLTA